MKSRYLVNLNESKTPSCNSPSGTCLPLAPTAHLPPPHFHKILPTPAAALDTHTNPPQAPTKPGEGKQDHKARNDCNNKRTNNNEQTDAKSTMKERKKGEELEERKRKRKVGKELEGPRPRPNAQGTPHSIHSPASPPSTRYAKPREPSHSTTLPLSVSLLAYQFLRYPKQRDKHSTHPNVVPVTLIMHAHPSGQAAAAAHHTGGEVHLLGAGPEGASSSDTEQRVALIVNNNSQREPKISFTLQHNEENEEITHSADSGGDSMDVHAQGSA